MFLFFLKNQIFISIFEENMEKEIRCAMEHLSNVDPIMHSIMVRHQWECPIGQQSKTIYELFIGAIIGQKI